MQYYLYNIVQSSKTEPTVVRETQIICFNHFIVWLYITQNNAA